MSLTFSKSVKVRVLQLYEAEELFVNIYYKCFWLICIKDTRSFQSVYALAWEMKKRNSTVIEGNTYSYFINNIEPRFLLYFNDLRYMIGTDNFNRICI